MGRRIEKGMGGQRKGGRGTTTKSTRTVNVHPTEGILRPSAPKATESVFSIFLSSLKGCAGGVEGEHPEPGWRTCCQAFSPSPEPLGIGGGIGKSWCLQRAPLYVAPTAVSLHHGVGGMASPSPGDGYLPRA